MSKTRVTCITVFVEYIYWRNYNFVEGRNKIEINKLKVNTLYQDIVIAADSEENMTKVLLFLTNAVQKFKLLQTQRKLRFKSL